MRDWSESVGSGVQVPPGGGDVRIQVFGAGIDSY